MEICELCFHNARKLDYRILLPFAPRIRTRPRFSARCGPFPESWIMLYLPGLEGWISRLTGGAWIPIWFVGRFESFLNISLAPTIDRRSGFYTQLTISSIIEGVLSRSAHSLTHRWLCRSVEIFWSYLWETLSRRWFCVACWTCWVCKYKFFQASAGVVLMLANTCAIKEHSKLFD